MNLSQKWGKGRQGEKERAIDQMRGKGERENEKGEEARHKEKG